MVTSIYSLSFFQMQSRSGDDYSDLFVYLRLVLLLTLKVLPIPGNCMDSETCFSFFQMQSRSGDSLRRPLQGEASLLPYLQHQLYPEVFPQRY